MAPAKRKPLTRDQILGAADLAEEIVPVPEWGGDVTVRGMSGAERDEYEASLWQGGAEGRVNLSNIRAKLCSICVRGEDGERMFSMADAEALGKKNAGALDRVANVARRLSGLIPDAAEEAREN